ncbi:MAG: ABC transporter permease [Granulosicoccaceae bacterium]
MSSVVATALRSLIIAVLLLCAWWLLVKLSGVPKFIFPSPELVLVRLWELRITLWHHTLVTFSEILLGLILGLSMGFFFALSMLHFRHLRLWLLPVLLASQAIPVFALAPLLVLWLGFGMASKVVMAALIIFFPVTMTCFDGLRHAHPGYLELARTLGASPRRQLLSVRLPDAMPSIASGLRMAVAVAPIGAVIGEWVGSGEGLGFYMLHANARMQVADMFAALFVLAVFSLLLYYSTDSLLKRLIPWHQEH